MIDLRSDTVTKPTPEMRQAMAQADVGDDVYGEDPSVNRLEELGAEMLGKEAALFVPSGTMANLVALLSHCRRGEEVILGQESHIYLNEVGGLAVVGGLMARTLPDADGRLHAEEVEAAIRPENIHMPRSALVCMENTHNRAGGVATSVEDMEAVVAVAREHGLNTHLDGARLFNAAGALGQPVRQLARPFDSVYICLSKGLGAPVGSLVAGSRSFVEVARKNRKMLGGGMRQAGVLAAAGIVALTTMVDRLPDDHAVARRIAEGMQGIEGISVDLAAVQTNIIFLTFTRPGLGAPEVSLEFRRRGILANASSATRMRLVSNHQVSLADADAVIEAFRAVFQEPWR